MLYVWQHYGQQSRCRKLPVLLWEEVIKTTRTDWQAEWWWWKLSKNAMNNLLQSGTHALWMCLRPCVGPAGQRCSAGVSDTNSHTTSEAVASRNGKDGSTDSSVHNQRWTLPDCSVSLCVLTNDVFHGNTSPFSQALIFTSLKLQLLSLKTSYLSLSLLHFWVRQRKCI